MEELVFNENGASLTSSLLVAHKFGKQHAHIMRDVRVMMDDNPKLDSHMFTLSSYQNEQNKTQPMYIMTRDGFTLLAMGFTGKKALQFKLEYINAFNEMESELKEITSPQFTIPQTYSEALRLAAEQAEQLQLSEGIIKSQAPKVEYHDKVLASKDTINTTVIAKELGMSATALNKKLNQLGVIYRSGESWVLFAPHQDKGYTKTKTFAFPNEKSVVHTYWTQLGRKFIHGQIKNIGL